METAVAGAEAGKLSGANSRRASRGSIDVPKIEPEQAPKMTAEQTRLLFRSADGPETAPAASTREMPPEKPPAVATMGSVYSGATAGCATERVPRQSSSSSRSSTNPPQTARPNASPKSASNVVGSASTETVGAVASRPTSHRSSRRGRPSSRSSTGGLRTSAPYATRSTCTLHRAQGPSRACRHGSAPPPPASRPSRPSRPSRRGRAA